MRELLKGKKRRTLFIGIAAAVCMVLAGATVYAVNAGDRAEEMRTAVSGAAATAQQYETQMQEQAEAIADTSTETAAAADTSATVNNGNGRHHNVEHQIQARDGSGAYCGDNGIGLEKAKSIALGKISGASAGDIVKAHCDYDDGMLQYEVEIVYNGYEYDFEINGTTGAIMDYDVDHYEYWD